MQRDTLAQYLFILCLNYLLSASVDLIRETGFTLKKTESRWYPAKTIIGTDYADDLALLTNSPAQAESLLYSLEQTAGDIGLYVNANRTEFMGFKQKVTIFTLSGKPLKWVDQFTYLGSNISSTESDINICLVKVWSTIDRLLIIWQSNLSDKIKWDFFQAVAVFILLHRYTTWTLKKTHWAQAWWELQKNATCCLEQILEATPHKTAAVQSSACHFPNHSRKTNKTYGALLKKQGQTHKRLSLMDSYTWTCHCALTSRDLHQLCINISK